MSTQNFPFAEGAFGPFAAPEVPHSFHPGDVQGQVFYVNANSTGSDDVDTPWPEVDEKICFSTMQGAIDACVDNRGDTIYVKRGGEAVTSTVLFDCPGIKVITQKWGMSPAFRGEYTSLYSTTLTGDPTAIISQPCYIEGLGFVGSDAGTSFFEGAALLLRVDATSTATADPFGVHLYQCRFPKWGWDNSKGIAIDGSSDCLIEECYFEGVGADFAVGIYVQGATANIEVRDCRFRDCDYAIQHGSFTGGGNPQCIYKGNIVATADSKFLKGAGNTASGIICDNFFYTDSATTSTNDASIATMETAGIASTGNHYSTEVGESHAGL